MTIEIVDFPIENGGSFHNYVNVYQRLSLKVTQTVCFKNLKTYHFAQKPKCGLQSREKGVPVPQQWLVLWLVPWLHGSSISPGTVVQLASFLGKDCPLVN